MPGCYPPATCAPAPRLVTLAAGTLLWRVESRTEKAPTSALHPLFRDDVPDEARLGGRFDPAYGTESIPYCYAATDELTAMAETFLRSVPWTRSPERLIPRISVSRRVLTVLEVTADLPLVALNTLEQLSAARQDTWLIHVDQEGYPLTQQWGTWLRQAEVPGDEANRTVAGLTWPSKRNPGGSCIAVFDPQAGSLVRSRLSGFPLDDTEGKAWVQRRLGSLRTALDESDGPT
jgi:hypothetical protein